MERWWQLLQSEEYVHAQKLAWRQRPFHLLGDQDVLTALLASKYFSDTPISILKRGKHIIQFNGIYGYTVAERIGNLLQGGPTFVHTPGGKPWSQEWRRQSSAGLSEFIKSINLDLSPYTLSALRFKNDLGSDVTWMGSHHVLSGVLRKLGMSHPALAGLPIAALMELPRIAKGRRPSPHLELTLSALSQPGTGVSKS
jgi:hypothetical protein